MARVNVTDAFCADPEGFLANNVVQQMIGQAEPGLIAVVVYSDSNYKVGNRSGGKVCVMAKARPSVTPALPAYWCPYKDDTLKSAMLGNDALFAFTPTMDGCSIGLGSGANGSQMLCHANARKIGGEWSNQGKDRKTGQARQSQSQLAQLRKELGNHSTIVSPSDYRADGYDDHTMSSTTYAVHALGKPWKLFTATYQKIGSKTYFHGGVKGH